MRLFQIAYLCRLNIEGAKNHHGGPELLGEELGPRKVIRIMLTHCPDAFNERGP